MLYRETIAVCSQIHKEHIHALCGQDAEFWTLILVVYKITTGLGELRFYIMLKKLQSWGFKNCPQSVAAHANVAEHRQETPATELVTGLSRTVFRSMHAVPPWTKQDARRKCWHFVTSLLCYFHACFMSISVRTIWCVLHIQVYQPFEARGSTKHTIGSPTA
jgi:hypothetical protein